MSFVFLKRAFLVHLTHLYLDANIKLYIGMHYWMYKYMEQEIISFYQYLISKKGKEVHLSNDLCFKYAMQNQEVASVVLDTLGFIVKPQDITIRSEI